MNPELDPSKPKTKKQSGLILGVGCGCLILILLLFLAGYLFLGYQGYEESPRTYQVSSNGIPSGDPYQVSSEQLDQLVERGYPDAFTILFYEVEGAADDHMSVRQESWSYYQAGIQLIFIDGRLEEATELNLPTSSRPRIKPQRYGPENFSADMNMVDVINATGIESVLEVPLENSYLEDGVLYFSDSLSFGMVDGELRYVEALAILEQ